MSNSFRYFLWRQDAQEGVLRGYFPDLLASDGVRLRRVSVGERILKVEQYEDESAACAVRRMVEVRTGMGDGLRGYAIYAQARGLALWRTADNSGSSWAAMPFDELSSGAVMRALLPRNDRPDGAAKLCGGARFRWVSGELRLDAALELKTSGLLAGTAGGDLLGTLLSWQPEVTVTEYGVPKRVRLVRDLTPVDGPKRVSPGRIETSWRVDGRLFGRLRGRADLRLWFVMRHNAELLPVPAPWDAWWMEVSVPDILEV